MKLVNQKLKFEEPIDSFGKTGEINPQSKIDSIHISSKTVTIKGYTKFPFAETSCTFEYSAEIRENKLCVEDTAVNAYNDFTRIFNSAEVEPSWSNRDKFPLSDSFSREMKRVTTVEE